MAASKRIALYGGTFDPVHLGHLEVARKVLELFEIEKVVFIPAQIAPHKVGRPVTEPIHRYAMLALATQDDPRLVISTFELDAPDRRYTVDTVAEFQRRLGDDTQLFFIMGADSWSEITTWRDWERLLKMANHIVVTRPGYEVSPAPSGLAERIFFTDAVMKDISATNIRRLASEGRADDNAELEKLVPRAVADYIMKYGIYRNSNEAKLNN
ncbi:MAG TPA: nicotinate-nucleotide adenylyltransferase [Pyrinomonadaceae bacterium]|jgi:nicotinate-nucleotide adenylyltransferase|nr:nicotinate-nucleotide adenylyltransferase [Pyrinomonadaceae bacterium]